jgi:hypothetical protein
MIERRAFLKGLLAGSAGPLVAARSFAAEPPLETTRLRLPRYSFDVACVAPKDHDYSLQALREIPYRRWRDYDSADTIRFLALRMHEARVIKSSPQKIIADGMDWRFVNELKKELKG